MKRQIILTLITITALALTGCTENARTKTFGGSMNVYLPANQKLVTATWKESQLWYLTRQIRTNETAETYTFQEKSSFGLIEGKVVFIESLSN